MEARSEGLVRVRIWASVCAVSCCLAEFSAAAGFRTANFSVDAPTAKLAREICETAERCRRELAVEWLGKELPDWSQPCPIKARVAPQLGAGGATSFVFDQGEVFGWRMNIQGSRERILDSVVPHEVTHTVFASHFRRPLPRWADEGACTTVEHDSEIGKQEQMLIEFLKTRRGIPFSDMFAMTEYPEDVLPLYAQGHSLAHLLISERGKRSFVAFLEDGMRDENWPRAIRDNYGYPNLLVLQNSWLDWIRAGRPKVGVALEAVTLASADVGVRREGAVRPASWELAAGGSAAAGRPASGATRVPLASAGGASARSPYEAPYKSATLAANDTEARRGFRGPGVVSEEGGDRRAKWEGGEPGVRSTIRAEPVIRR